MRRGLEGLGLLLPRLGRRQRASGLVGSAKGAGKNYSSSSSSSSSCSERLAHASRLDAPSSHHQHTSSSGGRRRPPRGDERYLLLLQRLGILGAGGAAAAACYTSVTPSKRGDTDAEQPLCKSVSVYASRGPRSAMEDEYFISPDESFFGVFDGHGGAKVSKYVRRHLYDKLQAWNSGETKDEGVAEEGNAGSWPEAALRQAFAEVSRGILENNKFDMQGSTAVTVLLGRDELWSTNLGDSRAVLCRDGEAVDLTEDHKPNSPEEKSRIENLGGNVRWYGYLGPDRQPVQGMGAYRINGNLAVSRAFGDRLETPYVSDEPDVVRFDRDHDGDRFIILASDGLWDVMTSQEAVKFVTQVMTGSVGALGQGEKKTRRPSRSLTKWMRQYSGDTNMVRAVLDTRKAKIAKYLVEESLRRGTADNVTVIVIWLR